MVVGAAETRDIGDSKAARKTEVNNMIVKMMLVNRTVDIGQRVVKLFDRLILEVGGLAHWSRSKSLARIRCEQLLIITRAPTAENDNRSQLLDWSHKMLRMVVVTSQLLSLCGRSERGCCTCR